MTVCLCMIVKDGAETLPALLESVAPHIDTYCIHDTGSSDNTLGILERELSEFPGVLASVRWENFGANRTRMLQRARGMADWLLLLDADWILNVPEDFDVREALALAEADCLSCFGTGSLKHRHHLFLRGGKPWKAVGPVHEYITCDESFTGADFGPVTWTHARHEPVSRERLESDLALLNDHLHDHPDDTRSWYYLAQTYKDLGDTESAVKGYLQRARMPDTGNDEVFMSLYLAGQLKPDIGLLMEAWAHRPNRAEPLFRVAKMWFERGHYDACLKLLERGPLIPPVEAMFAEQWIYEYGIAYLRALCWHNTGAHLAAGANYKWLLEHPDFPHKEEVRGHLESLSSEV